MERLAGSPVLGLAGLARLLLLLLTPTGLKQTDHFFLMYLYCINEPAAFPVVRFRIYIRTSLISSLLLDGVPDLHAIGMRRINPVIQKVASPAINPTRS